MISLWRSFWFAPTPRRDLALFRIVVVSSNVLYLLGSDFVAFMEHASRLPDAQYVPLPAVRVLLSVLGAFDRPELTTLTAVYWVAIASGILAAIGWLTRTSIAVFAVSYLSLFGYVYAFTEYHHPPGLALIILLALPFSPAGSALSIDSLLASRAHQRAIPNQRKPSRLVLWPLRLAQCLLVLAYFSGASSKLSQGFAWANEYTLRFHIVAAGLPVGIRLAEYPTPIQLAAIVTLMWEASFAAVLLWPRLLWVYAPLGLAIHIGIYLIFPGHNFAPFVSLYAAFLPYFLNSWHATRVNAAAWPTSGDPAGMMLARTSATPRP